jgi:hypothetical protein
VWNYAWRKKNAGQKSAQGQNPKVNVKIFVHLRRDPV